MRARDARKARPVPTSVPTSEIALQDNGAREREGRETDALIERGAVDPECDDTFPEEWDSLSGTSDKPA